MSNDLQVGEMSVGTCVFEMIGAMGGKEPPVGFALGSNAPPSGRSQPELLSEQPCRTPFAQSTENSISTQSMGGATSTAHLGGEFRKRLWTRWLALKLEQDPTSIDLIVNSYKHNRKTIPMFCYSSAQCVEAR